MPIMRFEAWMNGNDEKDPGHMGMLDEQGGYYYEFEMGKVEMGKAEPGEFRHEATPLKVTVRDVRSQKPYTANSKTMTLHRSSKQEYFRRMLLKTKPGSTTFRFTHMFYVEAQVTGAEYGHLMKGIFLRGAGGTYNFMKEMQVGDPLATRCLSLLEDLALYRHQKLAPGTALDVLSAFARTNALTVHNDPLISY
jgi:hypothetical protein